MVVKITKQGFPGQNTWAYAFVGGDIALDAFRRKISKNLPDAGPRY